MKRGLILFLALIVNMPLIFAYGGSYINVSPSGFFSELNVSIFLLAITFVLIFWVLHFAFKKTPLGRNAAANWIIPLILSIFSIYGILKSNFSIDNFVYGIGLSKDFLITTLIPILFILVSIITVWKTSIKKYFMSLFLLIGTLLIGLSFLDVIYERGIAIFIGAVSIIIGLIFAKMAARDSSEDSRTYRFGKRMGGRIASAGSGLWSNRPTRGFFRKEKKLIRRIKKLQRAYVKATRKGDLQLQGDITKQIDWLQKELEKVRASAPKAPTKGPSPVRGGSYKFKLSSRRGGLKPTKSRFVKKDSVERYARRFGDKAAKKRFG